MPISSKSSRTRNLTPAKKTKLARLLWGWTPHPTQREWLLDEHPVKVATCGRRWGKTEAAAIDVATFAIANKGSVQMIVAPTYDQSRLISNTVERLLLMHGEIRPHVCVTRTPYPDMRYRGSRIMARTADEDGRNLRGHSADRVIVDEAAFVRDRVVEEVIGPMLADRNGLLVMLSTPFGKNHFYRAFVQGQEECGGVGGWECGRRIRSFRFPSWANPHISREYIEGQRLQLSERQFKAEYEAEFVDDVNSVFPWEHIQWALMDEEPAKKTEGTGVCVAGIDWARYSDYTAVVVLEVGARRHDSPTPSHRSRVVALERFNRMDWHAQVARTADLLCRYEVRALAADQTSTGDPVLEMLRDTLWGERRLDAEIEGVVLTNQSKRELIDNLALRLAHREVAFPPMEQLVRELQYYEYELTQAGNVRTNARSGHHDDCVIALALALSLAPRYRFEGSVRSSDHRRPSTLEW